jgi:NADH:ubiquinone oxidoreductase subunit F (NADH-binding)
LAVGRHPVLVHNVETLANIALIARYGADWFSSVGTPEAPGTVLVTISGEIEHAGVVEAEIGMPIDRIVELAVPSGRLQAVLVGGYGGHWLAARELSTPYAPAELRGLQASMGVGVLVALTTRACGIRETERIARFMAAESAGQCGPCLFGLPAIAEDLHLIAEGEADTSTLDRLVRRCGQVDGRGACRHPDGVVRMVRSAFRAFADDFAAHVRGEPCAGATRATVLPFSGSRARRG